ncbi:hypothetical protein [Sulfurimonas sp.]|uniref:hypothetical protein n=1 Tax=Sulfurimonas sp. TaxID=2022749 RepID=UPI0026167DF9|nr:hypothetical protein [Sulfurimonas sp.]
MMLVLLTGIVYANDYREIRKFSLKKDEQKKILVKYDLKERLFKFRWTLFVNDGLVMHRSYDKIVSQNILYLNGRNQSVHQELMTRGAHGYEVPYLLLKFKKFDMKKHEALFELFLYDKQSEIKLEILKNKDEMNAKS